MWQDSQQYSLRNRKVLLTLIYTHICNGCKVHLSAQIPGNNIKQKKVSKFLQNTNKNHHLVVPVARPQQKIIFKEDSKFANFFLQHVLLDERKYDIK